MANAIQAIDNDGEVSIATKLIDNQLELTITDTGKGINKSELDKIFDPFYTSKDPGQGVGLGLSLAYETIKEMNGFIEFYSTKGKGTTAKVFVPITSNIS